MVNHRRLLTREAEWMVGILRWRTGPETERWRAAGGRRRTREWTDSRGVFWGPRRCTPIRGTTIWSKVLISGSHR